MDIFMHFQLRFKEEESCRVQKNSLCNVHIALHLPFIMCAENQTPKRRLIKPDLPVFILRRRKTHFDLRFCVFSSAKSGNSSKEKYSVSVVSELAANLPPVASHNTNILQTP